MELSPKTRKVILNMIRAALDKGEALDEDELREIARNMEQAELEKASKKEPKETDEIKAFLKTYTNFQKRIDNTEKRLAALELTMYDAAHPNLSGMPGGSGDSGGRQERTHITIEELRQKLGDLNREESRYREEIEEMVELMEKPDEQTVTEMRYLDKVGWSFISVALFGDEPDYDEEEKRYLKRTFKVHGSALQSLAKIYKERKGGADNDPGRI